MKKELGEDHTEVKKLVGELEFNSWIEGEYIMLYIQKTEEPYAVRTQRIKIQHSLEWKNLIEGDTTAVRGFF